MMASSSKRPAKSSAVDKRLVRELQKLLKGNKDLEVLGHLATTAFCCGDGTVALVKIDKGDPARSR